MTTPRARLVLVATPIGNVADLSPRAIETLGGVDVIACEDTRRTGALLARFGVDRPRLIVVNEHTESGRIAEILAALDEGRTVAVVSDAGTPGVSDPGERLVRAALDAGHEVAVVPGPSAAIAALVTSGLPTGRFCFEGFLPRTGSARRRRLEALAREPRTMVLFEAPHRLHRTLSDLEGVLGPDRAIAVSREITKLHEEIWRGPLGAAEDAHRAPRGEFVLVVAGAPAASEVDDDEIIETLRDAATAGADRRSAVATVARDLAVPKRRVYSLAQNLDFQRAEPT